MQNANVLALQPSLQFCASVTYYGVIWFWFSIIYWEGTSSSETETNKILSWKYTMKICKYLGKNVKKTKKQVFLY